MFSEKIKDYLIFFPKERVILFSLHDYIHIIANNLISDYDNWGLLDNKLITQKEKYFLFFLEKNIDKIIESFIILFRDLNIKIYTIYKKEYLIDDKYYKFFKDKDTFYKKVLKIFKKKTKYIREVNNNCLVSKFEGIYKNIKIGIPSGEGLEFLLKLNRIK